MEEHSFILTHQIDGVNYDYKIIENEGHFGVELEGRLIAEIQHNEVWQQVSGVPIPDSLLDKIYDRIEDHYE